MKIHLLGHQVRLRPGCTAIEYDLGVRKKTNCTVYVVKAKAQTSYAATVHLIRIPFFAFAKTGFSHEAAHTLP